MTGAPIVLSVGSGGSGDPGLRHAADAFTAATGHSVQISYDNRIVDGVARPFDLVVASTDVLDRDFRPNGLVEEGGLVLGHSQGLGIAVRAASSVPELHDLDGVLRMLVAADEVMITFHSSGRAIEARMRDLGLLDQQGAAIRVTRHADGPAVMNRLLAGTGDQLAILSVNQIRRYADEGLRLAAVLPDALQHRLEFVAVPMRASPNRDLAWQFAEYCAGPARPILRRHGFA